MEKIGKFSKKTQIYWESIFCKYDKEAIIKDFQRRKDTFCQKVELLSSRLFQWKSHFFHQKIVFVNMSRLFSQEIYAENRHQFFYVFRKKTGKWSCAMESTTEHNFAVVFKIFSAKIQLHSAQNCVCKLVKTDFTWSLKFVQKISTNFSHSKLSNLMFSERRLGSETMRWHLNSTKECNFVKMWWLEEWTKWN